MGWLLAALGCGSADTELPEVPGFAGPSARARFAADPARLPDLVHREGDAAWGARLPERGATDASERATLVALEGGRWALRWRSAWTLWDPGGGLVAEQFMPKWHDAPASRGWPTPDGSWLVAPEEPRPLAPDLATSPRVGSWPAARGWVRAVWSRQGAAEVRPGRAPRARLPDADGAVARADHLVLVEPSGRERTLPGCIEPEAVWWGPGAAFLACRTDGGLAVLRRDGSAAWRVDEPHDRDTDAAPAVSANGDALVHVRGSEVCVHHRDGRPPWTARVGRRAAAILTDDASLVVVWQDGLGVFDAATGARLDPERDAVVAVPDPARTDRVTSAAGGTRDALPRPPPPYEPVPEVPITPSVDRVIAADLARPPRWSPARELPVGRPGAPAGPPDLEWDEEELRFRGADGALRRIALPDVITGAQAGGHAFAVTPKLLAWIDTTSLEARFVPVHPRSSPTRPLGFSDDGAEIGLVGPDRLRVYEAAGPSLRADHAAPIGLHVSAGGRVLFVARADGGGLRVDLADGTVRALDRADPPPPDDRPEPLGLSRFSAFTLDDEGRLEGWHDASRFGFRADGLERTGDAPWLDLGWLTRFPDARWEHPGRVGIPPETASCEPSRGLACAVVPADAPVGARRGGLTDLQPSPDGRWVVGRRAGPDSGLVLRGPDGAHARLARGGSEEWGRPRAAWAGPATLVSSDGERWTWWEEGVAAGSQPAADPGGGLLAAGDRIVAWGGGGLVVWRRGAEAPSCVLPVEGARVLSPAGRFAVGEDSGGTWRADLDRCEVLERWPPKRRFATDPTPLGPRVEALGWSVGGPGELRRTADRVRLGDHVRLAEDGALGWATALGFVWWRAGGEPHLCATPARPRDLAWLPDGGVAIHDDEAIRVFAAATVLACPPWTEAADPLPR